MKRNALALLLVLIMTLSLVSVSAMAETPTITIMVPDHPYVKDWEKNLQTQKIEEVCGVDLQFQKLPYDANERMQKIEMMALDNGRDFADIVIVQSGNTSYLGTLQTFAEMGLVVTLNDYMNDTPYLDASLANMVVLPMTKQEYIRYLTSTDGNIYCFGYSLFTINNQLSGCRIMLYEPWLKELGLEVPTTTEELRNVLIAFRDKDPNGNKKNDEIPLISFNTAASQQLLRTLMNPFIYTQENFLINEDGQLVFAPIQDGWKDGLAYIKSLVDDGLLSSLSFTQDQAQMTALMAAEEHIVGAIAHISTSNLPPTDARREQYVIMGAIEGPTGLRQQTQRACVPTPSAFITSNCKNVEAAVKVLDYLSSIEMLNWSRYGIEGENYVYLETPGRGIYESLGYKGDIYEIKNIWGVEQSVHWAQVGPVVGDGSTITYRTVYTPTEGNYNHSVPIGATIKRELDYVNTENRVGGLIFTAEEQEVVNEFRSTIEGAVTEAYTLFVTGNRDLESEWDAYVKSLYDMGLEPYMQALQASWDRANQK
ncbi:MAG: hypothetical protein ACOX58_08055 [Christensenellales bacterium]|jgi:putative aldouronate transport system substrate-binding protein